MLVGAHRSGGTEHDQRAVSCLQGDRQGRAVMTLSRRAFGDPRGSGCPRDA
jgi:hypothetical protein